MATKPAVVCECDLCGATATAEKNPAGWITFQIEDYYEDRHMINKALCPTCSWTVANKMGYATDKAHPSR